MESEKVCPKCPNSPPMMKNTGPFMIPALSQNKKPPISDRMGAPVQIYECPNCHLIELYHDQLS